MAISSYSFGGYFINDYLCLLVVINGYYINGYCEYFINGYWWLFYVILRLLVVILL